MSSGSDVYCTGIGNTWFMDCLCSNSGSEKLTDNSYHEQSAQTEMPKLAYISTAPSALRVLAEGQLAYFQNHGYDVVAVASPGNDLNEVAQREGVATAAVSMAREIRFLQDLVSLWRMWRFMRDVRPDIVSAGTPKGALLGMLTAWAARIPARIYLQRG